MLHLILTVTATAIGFVCFEAPETALELFGKTDKKATSLRSQLLCCRLVGANTMHVGMAGVCLFFLNTSVHEAIGWSHIVWFVENARAILNGYESKVGIPSTGRWFWLGISIYIMYGCLAESNTYNIVDWVIRVAYILDSIGGFLGIFNPRAAAAFICGNKDPSNHAIAWTRAYGVTNLIMCIVMVTLASW